MIDTHAHIFKGGVCFTQNARYVPDYSFLAKDYLALLEANNFTGGVLIQPSFLGTNNELIFDTLLKYPKLRGVIVSDPEDFAKLYKKGVCGMRLNLIGQNPPDFSTKSWQEALSFIKEKGLHIELHCELERILPIINELKKYDVNIIIDHLSRVSKASFKLLDDYKGLKNAKLFFKISGFYRLDGGVDLAKKSFLKLLDIFGPNAFIYGSDHPHTNYEKLMNFKKAFKDFEMVVEDEKLREKILDKNAKALFFYE